MQCPVCNVNLQMTERQGIEIDYCPQCRGVWLDRGELDKLIERSAAQTFPAQAPPQGGASYPGPSGGTYAPPQGRRYDNDKYDEKRDYEYRKHHKKKSFWGELFDFD